VADKPHTVSLSALTQAVDQAVQRATATHANLQIDRGTLMGRQIREAVQAGASAGASATHAQTPQAAADAIAQHVSSQLHVQLKGTVVQGQPGHLIIGFILEPGLLKQE
jgi:hypothetical protein